MKFKKNNTLKKCAERNNMQACSQGIWGVSPPPPPRQKSPVADPGGRVRGFNPPPPPSEVVGVFLLVSI